ncbi:extracellular solute-binding protein [Bradyrhizobium hipponense]|uniref:Extracellular solute-binding protein n=1 Tax=Bradyrhizobium hipponense TaxID=2605638 RepID=A0A5S4YAI3_9BRAD|nr:extracellular solute-binding protein [Bradyrhizobium hipponense]TYO61053.1 extracellular solute-binding protein [Bradyrhizobium hipponense]
MIRAACVSAILLSLLGPAAVHAETVLAVSYALPSSYKTTQEQIARRFEAEHPGVRIDLRAPLATYDDVVNELLKSRLTGGAPDIAFVGMNHIDLVAERGLAQPLDRFVHNQGGWEALGYYSPILSLGAVAGRQYGVPFAISLPVLHVNVDLVRRAGGSMEAFPSSWGEIAELGQKISALDPKLTGFTFQYDSWGNWTLQALIRGAGGRMDGPNGCGVGFDSPEGERALETLQLFHDKGVPAMSWQQVLQAFSSGMIGISAASGATTVRNEAEIKTAFEYRTLPFPITSANGKLPAGGSMLVVTTSELEKQKLAWDYVKFATGPAAQTIMAENTGYLPVSQRAVDDPAFLGSFYKSHPNQATALAQMGKLTRWYMWPGPNGLKVPSVIQEHVDAIITGKAGAGETMPKLGAAVTALLPPCKAAK